MLWIPSRPAFARGAFTLSDLGTFGGKSSESNSINVLSHVRGFALTTIPDPTMTLEFGEEGHGFFWDGSMHDLGTLGGPNSIAIGINDKDWLVGWSQASFDLGDAGIPNLHAVIWKNSAIRDMGSFGGPIILAFAINNNGLAVGQSMRPDFSFHAFTWQNGVLSDLGLYPATLRSGAGGTSTAKAKLLEFQVTTRLRRLAFGSTRDQLISTPASPTQPGNSRLLIASTTVAKSRDMDFSMAISMLSC